MLFGVILFSLCITLLSASTRFVKNDDYPQDGRERLWSQTNKLRNKPEFDETYRLSIKPELQDPVKKYAPKIQNHPNTGAQDSYQHGGNFDTPGQTERIPPKTNCSCPDTKSIVGLQNPKKKTNLWRIVGVYAWLALVILGSILMLGFAILIIIISVQKRKQQVEMMARFANPPRFPPPSFTSSSSAPKQQPTSASSLASGISLTSITSSGVHVNQVSPRLSSSTIESNQINK